ncbi:putative exported protein (plasmid) [Paraburkholderia caribensis MBA4]|uniref:Putative exported protein n=2 Tax=Paraburkholderia caribensis TaxID=75105 RepID=A0A0P0RN14_9BURK|nr:putative exported protein [Paraburkholderia caribensis MBA4]
MLAMCAALFIGVTLSTMASAQSVAKVSDQQLDSLTAPIALYPDPLLAQVLMATTFPQEVESAAAWSKTNAQMTGDEAVKAVASKPWDPSVQSLVAFPQVLATMASKPDWVKQLGNAFLAQPNDVMDSVQRLRKQAHEAGNLKSGEQQKVVVAQNTIQIQPENPQIVYVPAYNPAYVYGPWLYPAYPPVYLPPPPGYGIASGFATGLAFGAGIAVTNALWGGFDWNNHDVNVNVNRYNSINVNNGISGSASTTTWNRNANFSSVQNKAYRGYDDARTQAMQTFESRTGENLSGSASQRLQDIDKGGFSASDLQSNADYVNRDNALRDAGDGDGARQDLQRGEASRSSLASNFGGAGGFGGDRFGGADRFGGGFGGGGFGGRFRR